MGNYFEDVDLWHLESTRIMHEDFETARNGGNNFLYRQEPDGTFVDVASELGVEDPGWTLAVGCADVDNNGWPDLYCANDFGADRLFLNHDGTFEDVSGVAISTDTKKGMNVDFGDFNNDGWLDIYVTNITTSEYLREGNMLWENFGVGTDGRGVVRGRLDDHRDFRWRLGLGREVPRPRQRWRPRHHCTVNGFISAGPDSYWYHLASWTVTEIELGGRAELAGDRQPLLFRTRGNALLGKQG